MKSKDCTPLNPYLSFCITAVTLEVAPVIVSPSINVPVTLFKTVTPCAAVGAEL